MLELIIERVRQKAAEYAGHCTYPFSQSLPPFSLITKSHPDTVHGICHALANRWIGKHANEGSLWSNFNETVFRHIMCEHIADGRGLRQKMDATKRRLAGWGLIPYSEIETPAMPFCRWGHGADIIKAAAAFCDGIVPPGGNAPLRPSSRGGFSDGHYLCLTVFHPATFDTHTVAVYVGRGAHDKKGDLLYFDANLGEFWFPNQDSFKPWLIASWKMLGVALGRDFNYTDYVMDGYAKQARQFPAPRPPAR